MLNSKTIYRLLFLPLLISVTLFASVFLTACACQPSPGKSLKFQIVNTKNTKEQIIVSPILEQLITQVSTKLFERKSNQPTLIIEKLKQLPNLQNKDNFMTTFNSHQDYYFDPIQLLITDTVLVDKKTYPEFIYLPKTSTATQTKPTLNIEYTFANQWKIFIKLQNVIFYFSKLNMEKPQSRFANKFKIDFTDQSEWSIDKITTVKTT